MSGPDRRKHPRIALAVDVDLTSEHNFWSGKTRDLSMGGLFIETSIGVSIGTRISVQLSLLGVAFTIPCEVAWDLIGDEKTTVGLGLRFLSVEADLAEAIERFMTQRAPVPFDMSPASEAPSSRKGPPPLP